MIEQIISWLTYTLKLFNKYNTAILVIVTIWYARNTYILTKETKNDRRYQYLQKRLEYLYYPLRDVFSSKFDLFYTDKETNNRVHFQVGDQKSPEILRAFHQDLKLDNINLYLYLAPPDLKKLFSDWVKKVSDFEDPQSCPSEEDFEDIKEGYSDIFNKTSKYIEKDHNEMYKIENGVLKLHIMRIRDFFSKS